MGLSGAKRRTKLSSDPNNTAWSKSTTSFGHKMLCAQGWKPGQLLGAENAAHAEHFTAANASHIRVMLREDNLGIGAQVGKSNAETFGLSTLSSIFGRLNGKSETDIEKMQNAQRDVELRSYQTRKFGHMTFVRGGLLVGDKMEDDITMLQPPQTKEQTTVQPALTDDKKKSNKRKHTDDDNNNSQRISKKQKDDDHPTREGENDNDRLSRQRKSPREDDENMDRATAKVERRARKEERRKRREERAQRREERRKRKSATRDEKPPVTVTKPTINPVVSNVYDSGRQAFRQRFMQQKRLASMDSRALNEILMFKPAIA